jgi:flagellar hook protein FlgE
LDGGIAGTNVLVGSGTLSFNTTGDLDTPVTLTTLPAALDWANGADQTQQVAFDMQTTQYASDSVVSSQSQDGYSAGVLVSLDIDSDGIVYGRTAILPASSSLSISIATELSTANIPTVNHAPWPKSPSPPSTIPAG